MMTQLGDTSTPPPAPIPVQVIGYATGGTINTATTGARVLLGILAGLHILLGAPLIVWGVAVCVSVIDGSYADPAVLLWALGGILLGVVDVLCGVWLLRRRPWSWRAAHIAMAVLCALNLLACGFFGGVVVYYRHAQGWDGLALAIGLILFIACSVLFWLHALTKLALLRLSVRRAFFLGDFEPHRLHRIGTFTMMALYGLVVLVGTVWFIVR